MFYDNQPKEKKEAYKEMLIILGSLSRLFSTAEEPYLYYRAHEKTTIAKYRNLRIRITMNMHGLNRMLYHIVKRVPHAM